MEKEMIFASVNALYTALFIKDEISAMDAYTLIEDSLTYQHNLGVSSAIEIMLAENVANNVIKRVINEKLVIGD